MYSTYTEAKLIVAEGFIRTLKTKIYKNVTSNDNKSYLCCLNKLIDAYNKSYHLSIGKNLYIMVILLWLKKSNSFIKLLDLKLVIDQDY